MDFKKGDIVEWIEGPKAVGTVVGLAKSNSYNLEKRVMSRIDVVLVDWNIIKPQGYSQSTMCKGDLALFKFQIGDKVKVTNLYNSNITKILPIYAFRSDINFSDRLVAVFRYGDCDHTRWIDKIEKVEDNMEDVIKRLEADLKKALQEVEELKKELEPKADFSQRGLYVAKRKKDNALVLVMRMSGNNDSVYIVDSEHNAYSHGGVMTFLRDHVVQRSVKGVHVSKIIEDLMRRQ